MKIVSSYKTWQSAIEIWILFKKFVNSLLDIFYWSIQCLGELIIYMGSGCFQVCKDSLSTSHWLQFLSVIICYSYKIVYHATLFERGFSNCTWFLSKLPYLIVQDAIILMILTNWLQLLKPSQQWLKCNEKRIFFL